MFLQGVEDNVCWMEELLDMLSLKVWCLCRIQLERWGLNATSLVQLQVVELWLCQPSPKERQHKTYKIIWAWQPYHREFCIFFLRWMLITGMYSAASALVIEIRNPQVFERERPTSSWAEWPFIAGRPGIFSWYYSSLNTPKKSLQEQLTPHLNAHVNTFCLFETQLRNLNAAHFPTPACPKADLLKRRN